MILDPFDINICVRLQAHVQHLVKFEMLEDSEGLNSGRKFTEDCVRMKHESEH